MVSSNPAMPPEPYFTWTVSLGNLLSVGTAGSAIIFYAIRMASRLNQIELRLQLLWNAFKKSHDLSDDPDAPKE